MSLEVKPFYSMWQPRFGHLVPVQTTNIYNIRYRKLIRIKYFDLGAASTQITKSWLALSKYVLQNIN